MCFSKVIVESAELQQTLKQDRNKIVFCSPSCYQFSTAVAANGLSVSPSAVNLELKRTESEMKKPVRNFSFTKYISDTLNLNHSFSEADGEKILSSSVDSWLIGIQFENLVPVFHEKDYTSMFHLLLCGLLSEDFDYLEINDPSVRSALTKSIANLRQSLVLDM